MAINTKTKFGSGKRQIILARHDHFGDAVLGEKLPVSRPTDEQTLDAAIGKSSLNGKLPGELNFNFVARGQDGGSALAAGGVL